MAHLCFLLNVGPSISWDKVTVDAAFELIGFLSYFGAYGALGFRFLVLQRTNESRAAPHKTNPIAAVFAVAERGAAIVGVVAALLFLTRLATNILRNAAAANVGILDEVVRAGPFFVFFVACGVLLLIGFACASRGLRLGWVVAALVAVALPLRTIVIGDWAGLVTPLHKVAASLWLGTLVVIVIVGIPAILRSGTSADLRASLLASLITKFSRLALVAAGIMGVMGIITAWMHLKYLAALWTTPYGYALIAKLCVVAIVVVFGAWNWRRMAPKLGTEDAAHALRRSATKELVFALIVLVLTAVLVSLPVPKLPAM